METVLIIEPDRFFKENLVELLELEGFRVKSAGNVADARTELNECKPSIIICDENLLTREFGTLKDDLKKAHEISHVIIIIIDGLNEKFEEADAYIKMPFRDDELLLKLGALTIKKRA